MREGWEIKKVKEICDKASSNIAQKEIAGMSGDFPVYGASGYVQNINFFHRDKPYIGIVKDGSGVGRVNTYPAKTSLLGTLQYIIPKDGYLLGYVAYLLKSLNLAKFATGAAIPHIYFKEYGECKVPVPPVQEQKKIVAELDCLTGIIEKKKQQLKELDNLAQSIFYDMFGDPITNEKGFPKLTIDDVIAFQGGSQPAKTYFEYEPTNNNIRLIQTRDYKTDNYITYIPKALARRFCTKDDIMIGRYGPPIFQILRGLEGAYNVALMKATPKMGNREFIRAFLQQKCLLHYLENFSQRVAGQDGIQMDKLKSYPFPYPPLDLQNAFAQKIEAIEKQKELIKKSIQETETLFNSRMDYWFN